MRAEPGHWLQNCAFCTQQGEHARQVGPLCSSGWIKVFYEYLKAEFCPPVCREELPCPHLQWQRAEAVPVVVVQERVQGADPEGMFRAGVTGQKFAFLEVEAESKLKLHVDAY